MDIVELDRAYSLSQLQEMARGAGLSASGGKKELIRRLVEGGVRLGKVEVRREAELSDEDIRRASQIIYDSVKRRTATVFSAMGEPMVTLYKDLTPSEQQRAFQGLKDRIQREGLRDYIERKRSAWGNWATDGVLQNLQYAGILQSWGPERPIS